MDNNRIKNLKKSIGIIVSILMVLALIGSAVSMEADAAVHPGEGVNITFTKYDAEFFDPLDGASFTLTDPDGDTHSWSGSSHIINGLGKGKYTLEETTTPPGHMGIGTISFEITDDNGFEVSRDTLMQRYDATVTGNNIEFEIYNYLDKNYRQQFVKYDELDNPIAGNYEFQITGTDLTGKEISAITVTNTNQFADLYPGTYTLTETLAPSGYEKAAPFVFFVNGYGNFIQPDGGLPNTCVVRDRAKSPYDVKIAKLTESGAYLAQAVLEITGTEDDGTTVSKEITTNGSEQTISLNAGRYTLREKTPPAGYETASDIEFTVLGAGEGLIVDGTASNRLEMVDKIKTEPPKTDNEVSDDKKDESTNIGSCIPARVDPPVSKVTKGTSKIESFTYALRAVSNTAGLENMPMPEGSSGNKKQITKKGAGDYEFGEFELPAPGTYVYKITEVDDGKANWTYDTSTYTVRYEVTAKGNALEAKTTITKYGASSDKVVFTNVYEDPEATGDEPEGTSEGTDKAGGSPDTGVEDNMPIYASLFITSTLMLLLMLQFAAASRKE